MASGRHKEVLNNYMKNHKNPPPASKSSKGSKKSTTKATDKPSTSAIPSASTSNGHNGHGSVGAVGDPNHPCGARMNRAAYLRERMNKLKHDIGSLHSNDSLPDEVLLQIFAYLSPVDLMVASQVCHRWQNLTMDNDLWKKIYLRKQKTTPKGGQKLGRAPSHGHYKNLTIKQCISNRNSRALAVMKKFDRFTGLPAKTKEALERSGTQFHLSLVSGTGTELSSACHSDMFWFRTALHVRWYSGEGITGTSLAGVQKLRIHAANPVYFDNHGKPAPSSPCQRSLLMEATLNWSTWKKAHPAASSDDLVDAYIMPGGVLLATWKSDGDLAFVSASFHHDELVERCIRGTGTQPYTPKPHKPLLDDLDTSYGLHSFDAHVEIRNQRASLWSQQFRGLHCKRENISGGVARFVAINSEDSYDRSSFMKTVQMPWKTEYFKGILQDICLMDVTMMDDQSKPMWCVSSAAAVTHPPPTQVDYEFVGEHSSITYEDTKGKVSIMLVWDKAEKQYYMTGLELFLKLQFINYWFGTRY